MMVVDALIYHPSVAHYLRYVATTVGRDKLLRTLQYFSRFYAWYLYRTNNTPATIAPYTTMKVQFGLTRKIMRIGKFVEHFKTASELFDTGAKSRANGSDQIIRYLAIIRQLGYAFYLSFDTLTVLDAAGIKKSAAAKRLQTQAYKAWLVGLIASALSGLYSNYALMQRAKAIDEKDGEGKVEARKIKRQRTVISTQLLSDLCDLAVPSSALGYANLDDGIVGLAGTVSSLIGVHAAWQKTG